MYSINGIFDAITPDNIKDIPVIQDAMNIFIETLNEYSGVSIDIKQIFDDNVTPTLKEELIKIYLDDIYRVLDAVKTNRDVIDRVEKLNTIYGSEYLKRDILGELTSVINIEHFVTSKSYKQKKGTVEAIRYIYDMLENIISNIENRLELKVEEIAPFDLKIEGSLQKEIYDSVVRPLAHPLGFTYLYTQVLKFTFDDLFNIAYKYTDTTVEVRCLSGNIDPYDKVVEDIEYRLIDDRRQTKVTFNDGTYLLQKTNPIQVWYYNADDSLNKEYPLANHCSIYLDYQYTVVNLTQETEYYEVTKNTDDVFWKKVNTNLPIIGQINVGEFDIGGWTYDLNIDNVTQYVTFNATQGDYTWLTKMPNNFRVGTSVIGEDYINKCIPSSIIDGPEFVVGHSTVGGDYVGYEPTSTERFVIGNSSIGDKYISQDIFKVVNTDTSEYFNLNETCEELQIIPKTEFNEFYNYNIEEKINSTITIDINKLYGFNIGETLIGSDYDTRLGQDSEFFDTKRELKEYINKTIYFNATSVTDYNVISYDRIGSYEIGNFTLGYDAYKKSSKDDLNAQRKIFYFVPQNDTDVGEFIIGESDIGPFIGETDSTEYFDIRNIKEEFSIETY